MPDEKRGDESFPKQFRLLKQSEFDAVYQANVFAADDVLVLLATVNGRDYTRLGMAVGRKVGNAVVRNRWKRAIREAFRKQRSQFPAGLDLLVRPRKGATCDSEAIFRSLPRLIQRLNKRLQPTADQKKPEPSNHRGDQ